MRGDTVDKSKNLTIYYMSSPTSDSINSKIFSFPGRWLGGISMALGPILLLAAELLRIRFHFFFPQQLKAFEQYPTLISTSYSMYLAGNILLWPAVITIANLIGQKKPVWAVWGGAFVMFGLFARTFHYGINHLAFQLVHILNLQKATETISLSYGAFHIISTLTGTILVGWVLLAVGAYLSGTLGLVRSIALAVMSTLMIGVLKGSSLMSVIATASLCIAFVPLGIKVLLDGPRPETRPLLGWSIVIVVVMIALFFLGQAG